VREVGLLATTVLEMPKGDDRVQVVIEVLGKVHHVAVGAGQLAQHS